MEVSIIPKLKNFNEVSIQDGDTLIAFVDTEKFTIDNSQQILHVLKETFPKATICCLFNGIEIGVIHNDKDK